jgi:hypothetical protein
MLLDPFGELLSREMPGREIEHQALLLVDGCEEFEAVQYQEGFHRSMGDPLIAVKERMLSASEKPSAAALAGSDVCKSTPPKLARGCASADSSAPRSRTPVAPPELSRIARCRATTSPTVK